MIKAMEARARKLCRSGSQRAKNASPTHSRRYSIAAMEARARRLYRIRSRGVRSGSPTNSQRYSAEAMALATATATVMRLLREYSVLTAIRVGI